MDDRTYYGAGRYPVDQVRRVSDKRQVNKAAKSESGTVVGSWERGTA